MKLFITSSVEKNITESAKLAESLGVGLEISRLPGGERIDDDFPAIINDLQESLKDFSGEKTLHALFSDLNPGSKDAAIKKIAEKRYQQSFEVAKAIGAKNLVFHSGHKGMKHNLSVATYQKRNIDFWKEFIKQFEDNGMIASLENVLENSYENINTIADAVNSKNLKACLDTGHANLCSQIPAQEWIKAFGSRLHHMHIHNNYGTNDDHFGLKYGTVNFLEVINTLKETKTEPIIVFEMFNKEHLIESIKMFKTIFNA